MKESVNVEDAASQYIAAVVSSGELDEMLQRHPSLSDLYDACAAARQSCHGDVLKAEIERLNTEEQ